MFSTLQIIVYIVGCLYLQVDSKEVTPASKEVTATLNSDVELKWTISSDITIFAISVYIGTNVPENKILSGTIAIALTPIGTARFGDRISAEVTNKEAVVKLQKVQLNETNSVFIIDVVEFDGTTGATFSSEIKLIVQEQTPGGRGADDGGSNTGAIIGGVVGVILLIVLIVVVVFYYLRWKKNQSGRSIGGSDTNLKNTQYGSANEEHYAETKLMVGNYEENNKRHVAQEYAELGPGGGHDGPKVKPAPSNYHEVKRTEDGENARPNTTPPSNPAPPPPKPDRGQLRTDSEGNLVSDDIQV